MILYGILSVLTIAGCSVLSIISPSLETMAAFFPTFYGKIEAAADLLATLGALLPLATMFAALGVVLAFEAGVVIYGFALWLMKKLRILG